jgi:hypothetical protein
MAEKFIAWHIAHHREQLEAVLVALPTRGE